MRIAISLLLLISSTQLVVAEPITNLDSMRNVWTNESLSDKERWVTLTAAMQALNKKNPQLEEFFILYDIIVRVKEIEKKRWRN